MKIRIEHCDWLVWLVTKLTILASKHGRQLLNEVFIYSKDITPSPGYLKWRKISQWLLSPTDQKSFHKLVFKAVKNPKCSAYIDCQPLPAGKLIDQNLFSFRLKLLIFRQWWQLWMKSAAVKQRYQMKLLFIVFRSFVLLSNSMSWVN